MIHYLLLLTK